MTVAFNLVATQKSIWHCPQDEVGAPPIAAQPVLYTWKDPWAL